VRRNPLEQLNLFPDNTPKRTVRPEILVMDADALVRWKFQIFDYQQRVRTSQPPQQTLLFDLTPADRKARLDLELSLISRWKPPFNKENWERWGQPFG
jgi:hypothetical protein